MDKLVSVFCSVLDFFIAPHVTSSDVQKTRSRSLVGLLLGNVFNLVFIALGLGLFYPFTAEGWHVAVAAFYTALFSLALALLLVRHTHHHNVATHLLILSIYCPILLAICFTGGMSGPGVFLLVWLPIVAIFSFNWRLGLAWMAVAVLTTVAFFAMPYFGLRMVSVVPPANVDILRFALLTISLVGIGAFITVYTLINHNLVEEIADERRKYKRLANFDSLTSLPNRMNFHSKLEQAIKQAKQAGQKIGLLVMDLNKFKSINDTYGHSVGDELLHHMASRLIERVRGTDFVARLSGDEFIVIMENVSEPEDVANKAKFLINIIEQPYSLSTGMLKLSVSVGGAVYPEQEMEGGALFSRADLAMFYAKQRRLGFYMDMLPPHGQSYLKQIAVSKTAQSA